MPQKLVYLSTAIIPSTQANSVQIMKMCSAFCRFGFDVTLLAGVPLRCNGVDIFKHYGVKNMFSIVQRLTGHHRGSTFLLSLRNYPAIRKLAMSTEDILFYGRDVLALYALASAGRKVTYEVHDVTWKGPRRWAEERLIRSDKLEKLVLISHELKRVFLEKYGEFLTGRKVIVAPDAADEPPNFSDVFSLDGGADFNACYIGGFHSGRGIELMLNIAEKMPGIGFHFFGGTDRQINLLRKKSPPNAHFYGYMVPALTYQARNAADVLLMPYQKDVMVSQNASETSRWMSPVKLFEYMSSRKPIISSNHVVLQEVLRHNHNCLLCEPDNPSQWIRAIMSIRGDKQLSVSISEMAYKDFINDYTWDKRVERILFED